MSDVISIRLSLWDSGCLPALLMREIERVEKTLRVVGRQLGNDDLSNAEAYLGQLRQCFVAVEIASPA